MLENLETLLSGPNVLLVGAVMFLVAGAVVYVTLQTPDGETHQGPLSLHDTMLQMSARARLVNPGLRAMANLATRFNPTERAAILEKRVAMAGMSSSWPMDRVNLYKLVFGVMGLLAGVFLFFTAPSPANIVLGLSVPAAGWMGLDFIFDKRAQSRQQEIEYSLPDMLDQLTIIVEAGLGFEAAFQRVVVSNDNPLSQEFAKVLRSIRLGMPRSEALNSLLDRTDVVQLRMFVRALNQADKSGIPIGQVFRVQSDEAREKRRQSAEEKAMKLPVKLLFPLVLFILPALFIAILGPAAVRIKSSDGFGGSSPHDNAPAAEVRPEPVEGG
ncbi:MAG: type II secretion system F family protein [Acidimicrobiia bacterium]|nr:type II secretion system F family protein [Acidimicrobiia bacterium]